MIGRTLLTAIGRHTSAAEAAAEIDVRSVDRRRLGLDNLECALTTLDIRDKNLAAELA